MAKVMVFTPTWVRPDGQMAMRPETRAAVEGQVFDGELAWEIGLHNPFPGQSHRNVLAQYQRGREAFLAGDADAWLTFEHDMTMPADGVQRLWETMERTGAGVVYGVYMLRHGSWVLNAWEYIGDHGLGESLSLDPVKLATARAAGVARVCGVGWGCTLIRRDVVARFPLRDDGGAGDVPFAYDCVFGGVMAVADFGVACDHFDGGLRLRAFGGAMNGYVKVAALQDVVVLDGRESRRLVAGNEYEVGRVLANDLVRAGYVEVIEDEEDAESAGQDAR